MNVLVGSIETLLNKSMVFLIDKNEAFFCFVCFFLGIVHHKSDEENHFLSKSLE
jgi:hypothetical protein